MSRKIGVLFAVLSLATSPVLLFAVPTVQGVSGTVANGQTVIIQGSAFGPGPNVILFDDFEKGANGSPILSGPGSAQVGQWDAIGNGNTTTKYTNTTEVSGNLSFQAAINTWSVDPGSLASYIERTFPSPATQVFVSWWIYLPANDNFPGAENNRINWKQVWMMGELGENETKDDDLILPVLNGYSANTPSGWVICGNDANNWGAYINLEFERGRWHRWWTHIEAVPGGAGSIDYWELNSGGVNHLLSNDNATMLKAGGIYERIRFNGYADNSPPPCHPTYDDVYVAVGTNAQARVEIGNARKYEDSTDLTILTPTNWGEDRIEATVRQGRFTQSQNAYLFVVDAAGAVNAEGYPVTIGNSSAPVPTPARPRGVRVRCRDI